MPSSPDASSRFIRVGMVVGAHGLKGHLKIASDTADPRTLATFDPLYDANGVALFALRFIRMQKHHLIAAVDGVNDRTAAETLKGIALFIPRNALPAPDDGEFYIEDLVGLRVYRQDAADEEDALFGHIKAVWNHGAGDIIEITQRNTDDTVLFPFTHTIFPEVDMTTGRVTLRPPEIEEEPTPSSQNNG